MSYKAVQFLLTPKGNGWETFYKLCVTHIVSVLYMTSFDIVGAGLVPVLVIGQPQGLPLRNRDYA